ncbi:MAG: dihydropyrimidine dehydrogenase, partial [Candidatus Brockarchaeota archaeon]|nr:dihydropyrimidine dehydrogenase [Candidatus Brockarchaeota archaeon]
MPKRAVEERIRDFGEVALGYDLSQATEEAGRCLQCKNPKCVEGCPVGVEIPRFVKKIAERDFEGAIRAIKEKNSLPAVCGRVCPQEDQCEANCVLGRKGEPLAIGALERFAADLELKSGVRMPALPKSTGIKIAVVGSGPAGLTAAGELAKLGYR